MKVQLLFLALVFCFGLVVADVYMHSMRGSNDRNRETGTNRDNAQRLFDSQNNGKGGYCWGPPLRYYEGSTVSIEWTNQHGCGGDEPNSNCNIVLQYMCSPDLRDGQVTTTIPETPDANQTQTVTEECWYTNGGKQCVYDPTNWDESTMGPRTSLIQKTSTYGMHEPYSHWYACSVRQRNRNLFVADQNPGQTARNTRQNPGGTRHGYECAEERDYYPYWHPSPWRDIAILTDDTSRCAYYQSESQNVKDRNYCSSPQFNNELDCTSNGASWLVSPKWDIAAPDCLVTPWTRDNHLGNSFMAQPATYNWTIPYEASDVNFCTVRIRYNISTGDYDGWNTDKSSNPPPKAKSPVTNDPYVPFGMFGDGFNSSSLTTRSAFNVSTESSFNLSLAINTAQFGRTFQDRSHMFQIRNRPSDIPSDAKIWNVNVRGKRGNIVQVYPAVEYDFVPNRLHAYNGDFVHFQWTGCDHNPAGNDGEGKDQTDRSNIVMLKSASANYFKTIEDNTFFSSRSDNVKFAHLDQDVTQCLSLGELRQKNNNNQNQIDQDDQNCMKLNPAGRDFHSDLIKIETRHIGNTYAYMSSRNNNFSNRSQKGYLIIGDNSPIARWLIAIIVALSVGAICLFVIPFGLLLPTLIIVMGNALAQRM